MDLPSTHRPARPLQGESETGYYRYNGTPIQQSDKEYYEARGVKFTPCEEGGDIMPDGKRLKPWRLRSDRKADTVAHKKSLQTVTEPRELAELLAKLDAAYEALPVEDRPRFSEWVTTQQDKLITNQLLKVIFASGNPQACLKSIGILWEFGKSKPKAQLEISQPEPEMIPLTPQQLFDLACETNGMDPGKAMATLRASEPKKQLN